MKRIFEEPKVAVDTFSVEDVITTSYIQPGFSGSAPDSDDSEFGG